MKPDLFLPLQEPTFFILLCLRGGEKHGYAIMKEVDELSSGRVRLSTGTLYGAINRLLEQGLIERVEAPGPDEARGKKLYRLNQHGLAVFDAEVSRMRRLVVAAQGQPDGRAAQGQPAGQAAL